MPAGRSRAVKTVSEAEIDELLRRAAFEMAMHEEAARRVARIWHLLRPDEKELLYARYRLHVFPWTPVTA